VVSSGAAAADKGYLSGAAASLDRAARAPTLAGLTTTNGSPRLYAGASRTWSRVSSSMIAPGLPRGAKSSAFQSTAILRVPMPRNAEVDDGGMDLAVPADDDVYDPSHVLAGVATNTLAENG